MNRSINLAAPSRRMGMFKYLVKATGLLLAAGTISMGCAGDVDDIDVWIGQQLVEPFMRRDVAQLHLLARWPKITLDASPITSSFLGVARSDGRDFYSRHLLIGKVVDHAHEADAGDSDAKHCDSSTKNG